MAGKWEWCLFGEGGAVNMIDWLVLCVWVLTP